MNFFNKILKQKKDNISPPTPNPSPITPMQLARKAIRMQRISQTTSMLPEPKVKKEIDDFNSAIDTARNTFYPNRTRLYQHYTNAMRDAHLISQIRTARYTVQQSKFVITDNNDNPIKKIHNLFERRWFTDFMQYALDAEFYGHSLIEFDTPDANGEFNNVLLIPRLHVCPEAGFVKTNYYNTTGEQYRDRELELGLIEIGNTAKAPFQSLGMLEIASLIVYRKNYSLTDWNRASEKFGMPLLSIATDAHDEELDEIQNMAEHFGSTGYVVTNKDSSVNISSLSGAQNFYKIYEDLINNCDEQISKLINGQTMTSDQGASYAQANVHERILNEYTRARLVALQNDINDKLFPFLIQFGYPLQNCKFMFTDILQWYADNPKPEIEPENNLQYDSKKKNLHSSLNQLYN